MVDDPKLAGPSASASSMGQSQPASAPAIPNAAPTDRRVQLLTVGLGILRNHRPALSAVLEPWAARLTELSSRVTEVAKGQTDRLPSSVYDAAIVAGRAGTLLEREREARPVPVPSRLAAHEKEIQRVQARFHAVKHGDFLSHQMLLSLTPARIQSALKEVRQAGLADDGPAWALKQREIGTLVKTLLPALKREMERDQGLA
jgi:hypothetical protein